MKKDKKQRLFEVMARLDKTFKPKLNENLENNNSVVIINSILSEVGGKYYKESEFGSFGRIDTGSDNAWIEISYSDRKNEFICSLIFESERMDDLLGKTVKVPMDFNNPEITKEKLKKTFNNLNSRNVVDNISEDIYDDDSPTSRMFRDTAKAFDPEGYEERLEKRRPNQTEPEEPKPQAMNQFKKDLNERKPIGINQKYSHFAYLKNTKKFVNGWDYRKENPEDLKQDKMHYFFQDIIDMDIDPKNVLIGTVKKFKKEGIDPFDSNNWYKFNADGWQERDDLNEMSSQVKYRAEVTGKGENVWSGNAKEYDTEEEAKRWLDNLSQRWFGYDMGRVVPTTTPKGQPVDLENDVIYQNFRK